MLSITRSVLNVSLNVNVVVLTLVYLCIDRYESSVDPFIQAKHSIIQNIPLNRKQIRLLAVAPFMLCKI